MKASAMKNSPTSQQPSNKAESLPRFDWGLDKGSKSEPFYIAAVANNRRSFARALQFDRRR